MSASVQTCSSCQYVRGCVCVYLYKFVSDFQNNAYNLIKYKYVENYIHIGQSFNSSQNKTIRFGEFIREQSRTFQFNSWQILMRHLTKSNHTIATVHRSASSYRIDILCRIGVIATYDVH